MCIDAFVSWLKQTWNRLKQENHAKTVVSDLRQHRLISTNKDKITVERRASQHGRSWAGLAADKARNFSLFLCFLFLADASTRLNPLNNPSGFQLRDQPTRISANPFETLSIGCIKKLELFQNRIFRFGFYLKNWGWINSNSALFPVLYGTSNSISCLALKIFNIGPHLLKYFSWKISK
jgi:hypothetical protein